MAKEDDIFTRILNSQFRVGEEVRVEPKNLLGSGSTYIGVARVGTATSSAAWAIVRSDHNSDQQVTRHRFRRNVAWDDRATGWS